VSARKTITAFVRDGALSVRFFSPVPRLRWLGEAEMRAGHPDKALHPFDRANRTSLPGTAPDALGSGVAATACSGL